jgi:hypothetical protein
MFTVISDTCSLDVDRHPTEACMSIVALQVPAFLVPLFFIMVRQVRAFQNT